MEMNASHHHRLKANISMLQCGFSSNAALTTVGFFLCLQGALDVSIYSNVKTSRSVVSEVIHQLALK